MDRQAIYSEISDLIKEIYGVKKIDLNSEIGKFRALSEDNLLFFEKYSERFNIDMSEFNYSKYFVDDTDPGEILATYFRLVFDRKRLTRTVIKVSHLVDVALKGEWKNPEPEFFYVDY